MQGEVERSFRWNLSSLSSSAAPASSHGRLHPYALQERNYHNSPRQRADHLTGTQAGLVHLCQKGAYVRAWPTSNWRGHHTELRGDSWHGGIIAARICWLRWTGSYDISSNRVWRQRCSNCLHFEAFQSLFGANDGDQFVPESLFFFLLLCPNFTACLKSIPLNAGSDWERNSALDLPVATDGGLPRVRDCQWANRATLMDWLTERHTGQSQQQQKKQPSNKAQRTTPSDRNGAIRSLQRAVIPVSSTATFKGGLKRQIESLGENGPLCEAHTQGFKQSQQLLPSFQCGLKTLSNHVCG